MFYYISDTKISTIFSQIENIDFVWKYFTQRNLLEKSDKYNKFDGGRAS